MMKDHKQFRADGSKQPTNGDFLSLPHLLRTDKDIYIKNNYAFNETNAFLGRGQMVGYRVVDGIYSVALNEYLIAVTDLVSAATIGLPRPSLAGKGKIYVIKDEVGGASSTTITVISQGEESIDGASSSTLTTNYQAKSFYSNGANWFTY